MRCDAFALQRVAHFLWKRNIPVLPKIIEGIIFLVFNSRIPSSVPIGKGSIAAYGGMSILIHRKAVIGQNVRVAAHVVIGGRKGDQLPIIEDDVLISNNAVVMGNVRIGKGAVIGAGALVLEDVPAGAYALAPKAVIRLPEK